MTLIEQTEGFALSQQQLRLWRLREGAGGELPPLRALVRLDGPLDAPRLEQAWRKVLLRHEALRTRVETLPGTMLPVQIVDDEAAAIAKLRDLSQSPRPLTPDEAPFSLAQISEEPQFGELGGAAVYAELARYSDKLHYLIIAASPLCCDQASLQNLVRELAAAYGGAGGSALPEEPLQYADYAAWQEDVLASDRGEGARYWNRQQEAGAEPLPLALEAPAEEAAGLEPEVLSLPLPLEIVRALDEFAARHRVTAGSVLLACWAAALCRQVNLPQLQFAYLCCGRSEEAVAAIGAFTRLLPMRCGLDPSEKFLALVRRLEGALDDHQDMQELFSAGTVWAGGGPGAKAPHIGFGYQAALPPQRAGALTMTLEPGADLTEPSRLHLQCLARQGGLTAHFHYDPMRFTRDAVCCLSEQWGALLADAIEAPDKPISRLSLLSAPERARIILAAASPAPAAPVLDAEGLHELFERQASLAPQEIALRYGAKSWTYAGLEQRANALAARLIENGVKAEVRVGLLIQDPLFMIAAIFAVLKAGGAYLPLDPNYPRERLEFMLQDAAAALLLAEPSTADMVDLPGLPTIHVEDSICAGEFGKPALRCLPDQLAYLIYTSGSTGTPKGVAVSHRAALQSALARHRYYQAPVRGFLLLSSFSFDSSVAGIFWTLSQGGCLCLPAKEEVQDPAALAGLIECHELSHLLCLPSLYSVLLEQNPEQLRSLRAAIAAGENCPSGLPLLHHKCLPLAELYNEYGPTEAAVWSTVCDVPPQPLSLAVSIGRPVEGARIYLLDAHGEPVPRGIAGEIFIGGIGVARGYFRKPGLTAGRFLPDPFGPEGSRMYRTGDLARFRLNCELEFLGRADRQTKIRGYRIELGEIESRILAMPEVRDCAVVAREDHPGERRLVAYVVARAPDMGLDSLRKRLSQAVPNYMVPAAWINLDTLPKTPNGKLDRARLPSPEESLAKPRGPTPPRNEVESVLVEIWRELLQNGTIGIEDSFFELGGDSILSIQMVGRARQRGLTVTARQLFDHQTIAALAPFAIAAAPASAKPAAGGEIPLTPIQRWFFDLGYAHLEHWTHGLVLNLREPLDLAAMELALVGVLRHHDALRTRFLHKGNGWRQMVAPDVAGVSIARIDLPKVSATERLAELKRIALARMEIDPSSGQMLRLAFAQDPGGEPGYLLVAMNHLVADGLSWRILLEDLQLAYRQARAGVEIALPAPTVSFAEWAQRLEAYAEGEAIKAEAGDWAAMLRQPAAFLPADAPEGSQYEEATAQIQTALDETATHSLLHRVQAAYRTGVEDLLLTALALALARFCGSNKVLIDLDRHGREPLAPDMDLSRTLGWFTSVAPYVFHADPAAPLAMTLKSVKERLRQMPRRGLHWGLLRYSGGEGPSAEFMQGLPRAQILFNYMGQLDPAFGAGSLFSWTGGEVQSGRDPEWQRPYELAVNADILDGCLRFTWDYSAARYRRGTIEALAQDCLETLQALIAHCLLPDSFGYTPSDFPLAKLDQARLDELLGGRRGIEDVYPLTPLQQGMLFHGLYAPDSGAYVEQLSCTLEGELDVAAFAGAWRQVVATHPVLRTSVIWDGIDTPLQVVHSKAELQMDAQDWRDLG
ncbi:MAG: amino acid adenylation domain-containing protein, partial [Beijerinckiaceae bacterium]|nr:amino acid adenylation domain-containing protein [Beijerinckiaceae bacterium]